MIILVMAICSCSSSKINNEVDLSKYADIKEKNNYEKNVMSQASALAKVEYNFDKAKLLKAYISNPKQRYGYQEAYLILKELLTQKKLELNTENLVKQLLETHVNQNVAVALLELVISDYAFYLSSRSNGKVFRDYYDRLNEVIPKKLFENYKIYILNKIFDTLYVSEKSNIYGDVFAFSATIDTEFLKSLLNTISPDILIIYVNRYPLFMVKRIYEKYSYKMDEEFQKPQFIVRLVYSKFHSENYLNKFKEIVVDKKIPKSMRKMLLHQVLFRKRYLNNEFLIRDELMWLEYYITEFELKERERTHLIKHLMKFAQSDKQHEMVCEQFLKMKPLNLKLFINSIQYTSTCNMKIIEKISKDKDKYSSRELNNFFVDMYQLFSPGNPLNEFLMKNIYRDLKNLKDLIYRAFVNNLYSDDHFSTKIPFDYIFYFLKNDDLIDERFLISITEKFKRSNIFKKLLSLKKENITHLNEVILYLTRSSKLSPNVKFDLYKDLISSKDSFKVFSPKQIKEITEAITEETAINDNSLLVFSVDKIKKNIPESIEKDKMICSLIKKYDYHDLSIDSNFLHQIDDCNSFHIERMVALKKQLKKQLCYHDSYCYKALFFYAFKYLDIDNKGLIKLQKIFKEDNYFTEMDFREAYRSLLYSFKDKEIPDLRGKFERSFLYFKSRIKPNEELRELILSFLYSFNSSRNVSTWSSSQKEMYNWLKTFK